MSLKLKEKLLILIQKWSHLWIKTYIIVIDQIKQHICCNCIKSTSILLMLSVEIYINSVTSQVLSRNFQECLVS